MIQEQKTIDNDSKEDQEILKQVPFNLAFSLMNNFEKLVSPVKTRQCRHIDKPCEYSEVIAALSKSEQFSCDCGQTFSVKEDIVVDKLYEIILRQVHKHAKKVSLISGYVFSQYQRKKKYTAILESPEIREWIEHMMEVKNKQNDFSNIIQQDKSYDFQVQSTCMFQAICHMDFIKIVIPVRHRDCKHAAAYELTSFLSFITENDMLEPNNKQQYFPCQANNCYVLYPLNLEQLKINLVIDYELIQAIKMGSPNSTKFHYDNATKLLKDEYSVLGYDEHLRKYWENVLNNQERQLYQRNNFEQPYQVDFEIQMLERVDNIFNQEIDQNVEKKLQCFRYQEHKLKLIDKFTENIIEIPARCVQCPIQEFMDLRSFIAYYITESKKALKSGQSKLKFKCPLCKNESKKPIINQAINSTVIYVDHVLRSKILEALPDKDGKPQSELVYQGKKIMLREFVQRHKVPEQQIKNQYPNGIIPYKNAQCVISKLRVKDPLVLLNCPERNRISFNAFFNLFQKNNYDSNNLTLCVCKYCSINPIKDFRKEVFYDSMLAEVLIYVNEENNHNIPFEYHYKFNKVVISQIKSTVLNQQVKQVELPSQLGFLSLLDDQEYQKIFTPFKKIQLVNVTQNIAGVKITHDVNGVVGNIQEAVNQHNANQNNYGITLTGMTIELKPTIYKTNRGKLEYNQFKK